VHFVGLYCRIIIIVIVIIIIIIKQYIKMHDTVSAQLHFKICKGTGVQLDKNHWYEHVPKSVETNKEVR
jgi:hypothetical protein